MVQGLQAFNRTRFLTGPLALFDLSLGIMALGFPTVYLSLLEPTSVHVSTYMLQRTGIIWLGFFAAETIAFFFYDRLPEWVLIVAVMRVDDVPADLFYRFADHELGWFGKWTLMLTPAFNIVAGVALFVMYFRARRQWMAGLEPKPLATPAP